MSSLFSRRKAPLEDDSHDKPEAKPAKSRKPPNTAFRQQRLLAYSPIFTPRTVLPYFFVIGVIFSPIGAFLLYASAKASSPLPVLQ
jgi:hypothetical protein